MILPPRFSSRISWATRTRGLAPMQTYQVRRSEFWTLTPQDMAGNTTLSISGPKKRNCLGKRLTTN